MNWSKKTYIKDKSLQENVGYSNLPEINEDLKISYQKLQNISKKYLKPGDNILDLGCGTGLFLAGFDSSYNLFGIDMSREFLEKTENLVPNVKLYCSNYLKTEFKEKFNLIYAFSVIQYIGRSKLDRLFKKIYHDLETRGIFFLSYSHAIQFKDLLYSNLLYIKYSPRLIEKKAKKWFKIIEHKHFFEDRKVKFYDKDHYYFPDGTNKRKETTKNTYLLVIQKI